MKSVIDITGREIIPEKPIERIVSLVPSITESLVDFGCREKIVGCTSFCEQPPEFHDEMKKSGGIVGGTKNPKISLIKKLAPDLVFANREENRRQDIDAIRDFAPVHVSEPKDVNDVDSMLKDIAVLLKAQAMHEKWRTEFIEARHTLNNLKDKNQPLKYAYLIWWKPIMVAAGETYISNLLSEGPFVNAYSNRERYPIVRIEDIIESGAEVVYCSTEPYEFDNATMANLKAEIGESVEIKEIDGCMCGWHGTRTSKALKYLYDFYPKNA
ncbi:MAG TPA: helical backbone metal receptor [bacterium]|jgi:ABC-type Fe3+-hydroxamate transport system substrate-binding protein